MASSTQLKIERAKEHIASLEAVLAAFRDSKPYGVVVEDNAAAGQTQWRAKVLHDPPENHLRLIVGDVVHNLRSALDHLMGDLVRAGGGEPTPKTEFPIGRDEPHYRSIRDGKTNGASAEALSILDSLRPYGDGNVVLFRVHHLDIVDKHRLLLTLLAAQTRVVVDLAPQMRQAIEESGAAAEGIEPIILPLVATDIDEVRDGTVLFAAPLGTKNEDFNPEFVVEICLDESPVVDREPVVALLRGLVEEVEATVRAFAEVLPDGNSWL